MNHQLRLENAFAAPASSICELNIPCYRLGGFIYSYLLVGAHIEVSQQYTLFAYLRLSASQVHSLHLQIKIFNFPCLVISLVDGFQLVPDLV